MLSPVSGLVRIRLPGTNQFITLAAGTLLPLGSVIDATHGVVSLTSAIGGQLQTANFSAGEFVLTQDVNGVTVLTLTGGPTGTQASSRPAGRPAAHSAGPGAFAAKSNIVRRLWGTGRGKFRTKGHFGAATVWGTVWETLDRCNGTQFRVARGTVTVLDEVRHLTHKVRAGHKYLVRAPAGQHLC
jgi:hypothetical protein